MLKFGRKFMLIGLALPSLALAQAGGDAVSQKVAHGEINWTQKTITATGSGAPSLKAANVAVARLGAERAAKMDALRNIIEAVKGVRISGKATAGSTMDASPELKSKVEGVVQNFKVLDTKYYSDGGVDVVVQVPIDGVLTSTLVPNQGTEKPAAASSDTSTTGVIVNAKGLSVSPALAPRLVDEKGQELYSAAIIKKDVVAKNGVTAYSKSIDAAMKDARVVGKPLIVKATKLHEAGGTDLVVSAEDAAKLQKVAGVLAEGKVIIVTD